MEISDTFETMKTVFIKGARMMEGCWFYSVVVEGLLKGFTLEQILDLWRRRVAYCEDKWR